MAINCKDCLIYSVPNPLSMFYCSWEVKLDGSFEVLGTLFFQMSRVFIVKKKLEKENCSVRIVSNTFYFKDLIKGLWPVVLAVSCPFSPSVFPLLCFVVLPVEEVLLSSLRSCSHRKEISVVGSGLSPPSPFKELDTCLPLCRVRIMNESWMLSGVFGKGQGFISCCSH